MARVASPAAVPPDTLDRMHTPLNPTLMLRHHRQWLDSAGNPLTDRDLAIRMDEWRQKVDRLWKPALELDQRRAKS